MRRRRLIGAGLAVMARPGIGVAQTRDLTVASWGGVYQDAQREAYFRPWTAAQGARMLEVTRQGGIEELRSRIARGGNTWDLVQVEADELLIGAAEGLFEPIDIEAIGGAANYLPEAVHPFGIGTTIHALILAWDRVRLGGAPAGWADLFDAARIPGRRALRRAAKSTLEVALLAEEVPAAALYRELATEAGLVRAFRRLDAIRDMALWWERSLQPVQWLATGEAALAAAQNGRVAAANVADGLDLAIGWTRNLVTMDSWVIMRGSPNRAKAMEFLHFAGQPAVQARLPPLIPYAVTARGAAALLAPEVLLQLPTAPQNARSALWLDAAFWQANGARLGARFTAWLGR